MAYTKYSLTPADNNAAPPDGAPEGMLPSAVNDTMRDMMSQIRDVGDGIRGGTYTMTAPVITGGSITGVALSGNTLTNPVISGGSINNTPIGASTANTGAFTTLGASGVATFSAGTVSAPSITTTGDTNTGIFFPAADTIAFTEGGVEAMRITSAGDVGIGTSSPASKLNIGSSDGTAYSASSSTGQAGVGATAQFTNLATGANAVSQILFNMNNDRVINRIVSSYTSTEDGYLTFVTEGAGTPAERMRIDSSGNLLVGATATSNNAKFFVSASVADRFVRFNNTQPSAPFGVVIEYTAAAPNDTGKSFLFCADNAATRADIRSNGGLANYSANNVNLSDAREKTNVELAGNYLSKICSIPVKTFNYIDQNREDDDGLTLGVIAQDVQAIAPELVTESDWGTENNSKMRLSIYQTDLQYALMKSIQELKAELDSVKAELQILKGK